jgi:hypothetical protein
MTAGLLVGASACVWPIPLPGQPVPGIEARLTVSAASGTLALTAVPIDITPTSAALWPTGFAGAAMPLDTEAPWEFVVDQTALAPGDYEATVMFTDGTTYVTQSFPYEITGCNGARALCGRSYRDVAYATAHNAMASAQDGWLGPNQQWDVPTQLEAGVRALMLDTYRAGDLNFLSNPQVPGADPNASYLCHSLCLLGSQSLADGLGEIGTFLAANTGEVITLIIESYLSHELTDEAFVSAGLVDDAYVHALGTPWPTLGELVDADTRLVVLQDRRVDPRFPYQMYVWDQAFETDFENSVPGDFSCGHNRGSPSNELFILNHFLTDVFGKPELADQVNRNPLLVNRANDCSAFQDTAVNFVTVDFVDIGDTLATVAALND